MVPGSPAIATLGIETALRWKFPEAQRQRIQMVLLRERGMTAYHCGSHLAGPGGLGKPSQPFSSPRMGISLTP